MQIKQLKKKIDIRRYLEIGAVMTTDTIARRDYAYMHVTLPKTFVCYEGNSFHPTDYTRIDEWVKRILYRLDHGPKEMFFSSTSW